MWFNSYIEESIFREKLLFCGISQEHYSCSEVLQKVFHPGTLKITKQQNSYLYGMSVELRREYPLNT